MPATPIPTPVQAAAPDLARRFGLIVAGLAALVAQRFLRDPRLQSLIIPLWTRLTRTATRFTRLMTNLAANRPPRPRPTRRHRKTPGTAKANPLPATHGWLLRALPIEAAAYAAQPDALLAEPATADLLAAHPAAARLLRPLARTLGLATFAPKRTRPKPNATAPTPRTASQRTPIWPPHPDPDYRPSANWPRRPWPGTRHPSGHWRRPAPA